MPVDARERLRVVVGAAIGVLLTGLLCRALGAPGAVLPWLAAPIGASAVLVFGVPGSPMAQPWAVIAGNTVSALAGIVCVLEFGSGPWVAALAVGLAIAAMFALRCLHPPGGACALLTVLGGVADPHFALSPVLLNSVMLVMAGVAYNGATGRRYPHGQHAAPSPDTAVQRFDEVDLDAVIARYNQVLDIGRDDLQNLLGQAELEAYRRKMGATRCADIMSRQLVTAEFGTSLQDAWARLRAKGIKALPVVDRAARVVGIVTLADFLRGAELDLHAGWAGRLRAMIRATTTSHSDKAEVVGQIMTRRVRVASAGRPISELVPMFA
ncbi:MAG TPA: HPP family protein, partial [Burkholderiaceae bacterium]|nr:HPP family protein [Burkholderiaceae bacterium]